MISQAQAQRLFIELSSLPGGRRREPGEFESEEPSLVKRMVESLEGDGLTRADIAEAMTAREEVLVEKYLGERPHLRTLRPARPRLSLQLQAP
jgi:hypothetical protein